jgi:hypothetical protein
MKAVLPLQNGHALLQPTFGDPVIQKLAQTMELPGVEGRVSFATAQSGRLLALADMENHVIEWLGIHDGSRSTETMPHTREWLSVTRSHTAGVWMAVDREGRVCEFSAQNEPIERWRAHDGTSRLASLNAAGDRVLFDTVASPEVMLIERNGRCRPKTGASRVASPFRRMAKPPRSAFPPVTSPSSTSKAVAKSPNATGSAAP